MIREYSLNPVDSASPPIVFAFDYDLQVASGRDADTVNEMVREAVDGGSISAGIECFSYPIGDSVDEAELGSILSIGWITSADFPELEIPGEMMELPDIPGLVS